MAGEDESNGENDANILTPRSRGIIQHFTRLLNMYAENHDNALNAINENLAALRNRVDRLEDQQQPPPDPNTPRPNIGQGQRRTDNDEDNYVADTEDDDGFNFRNERNHRRHYNNQQGMNGRREVREDPLGKIKFTMPSFAGKYDPDWELVVEQKFSCY